MVDGRIGVTGEVDLANADELLAALQALMPASGDVILDLSGLEYLDSSGIRVLVNLVRPLSESGRSFVLTSPQPNVRRVLEIVGLDRAPGFILDAHEPPPS